MLYIAEKAFEQKSVRSLIYLLISKEREKVNNRLIVGHAVITYAFMYNFCAIWHFFFIGASCVISCRVGA